VISSVANPHIARALRLRTQRRRAAKGQVFVEGARGVHAALDAGRLREIFVTEAGERRREGLLASARAASVPIRVVSAAVMAAMTTTTSTPDIAGVGTAVIGGPEVLRDGPWPAVLLRGFRDPAAAGAILATSAAMGVRAALQGATTVDLATAKVVRAAAGAHFSLRVGRSTSDEATLDVARAAGAEIVCLHPEGASLVDRGLPDAMMLVVQGSDDVLTVGDPVWVPTASALPVGQMAAMVLYEWRRGRA
jgi:RNA methyltransferase, TrmH family